MLQWWRFISGWKDWASEHLPRSWCHTRHNRHPRLRSSSHNSLLRDRWLNWNLHRYISLLHQLRAWNGSWSRALLKYWLQHIHRSSYIFVYISQVLVASSKEKSFRMIQASKPAYKECVTTRDNGIAYLWTQNWANFWCECAGLLSKNIGGKEWSRKTDTARHLMK